MDVINFQELSFEGIIFEANEKFVYFKGKIDGFMVYNFSETLLLLV